MLRLSRLQEGLPQAERGIGPDDRPALRGVQASQGPGHPQGKPACGHLHRPECETNRDTTTVGQCPYCGKDLRILYSRFGKRFIGCSGYPNCKRTYPLPQLGTVYSTGSKCETCGAPIMGVKGARSWQFCADMDCASNKRAKKKEAEEKPKKAAPKKTAKKAPAKKTAAPRAAEPPVKRLRQRTLRSRNRQRKLRPRRSRTGEEDRVTQSFSACDRRHIHRARGRPGPPR